MLQTYNHITHQNKKIEGILKSFFLFHPKNIDLSLDRIIKLLNKLNNPHKKIKNIIHIAGTNGKGSIATILYNLQMKQGKTVNVYRSPHLISFNERIYIKNKKISNKYLLEVLDYIKQVNDKSPITFFEIITAVAFYVFYKNTADITILEVGLGGRYDATNVIESNLVSIVSTIDYDHKDFLGNTIKLIANEKVGIIKKNGCVISSKQNTIAKKIIRKKSKEMKNILYEFDKSWEVKNSIFNHDNIMINLKKLSLLGEHQYINASCALMACIKIKNLNINLKSLDKILPSIHWAGRLEKIQSNIPREYDNFEIWTDVAHNRLGFKVLSDWINKKNMKDYYMILALGIKKDYKNILKEIQKSKPALLCLVSNTNFYSHDSLKIKIEAKKLNINTKIYNEILDALNFIKKEDKHNKKKQVIITGSIGLVGSFISKLQ